MADDPRIRPLAEKLHADYNAEHDFGAHLRWQDFEGQAKELLTVQDAKDPLHGLLDDRVRFHELVRNAGESVGVTVGFNLPAALLAALREVAGL